jgi:UDP-N-acetylmuramate: L-alanyl-gamma-D-glutamyl-meso-diaminopimelate ligase
LIRTIPSIGKVIANKQDKNIETLLTQGVWSELDFFNTIESWHHKKEDNKNHIYKQDKLLGELKWDLMGEYNVHNALAAIAAVSHVGVSPNDAINSLKSFKNTTRRMQLIFQSEEIRIYDDFAHHPTAIKSVIEAFKQKYPEEKSLIVLDPRSNTMKRGDLKEDLKRTLEMADAVTIFSKNLMWDITSVKTDKNNISLISDQVENIFEFIKNNQSKFNNIIMLSNGSFDGLTKKITDYFENEKK